MLGILKHGSFKKKQNYSLIILIFFIVGLMGCAGSPNKRTSEQSRVASTPDDLGSQSDTGIGEVLISEFYLSPGDEIRIFVYQREDLTRTIKIPPDGVVFFPIVGEIDTGKKTLRDLRFTITEGLSKQKIQTLLPGDEVSLSVFLHDEYTRQFIVPSDGYIFVPNVGDIQVEGKSLREIRNIISHKLSESIVEPQVIIDIVQLNNPHRIADPQVSIEVIGFGGQKVYVLGEVNRPGVFLADGHTNMVEAIALAGGPTSDAKTNSVLLIRSIAGSEKPDLVLLDMDEFLIQGDMSQNPKLQRGDIIFIPRTFIADVDRFFEHLARIISPLLDIETMYWLGQNIVEGPARTTRVSP
jgi:polysaccharide export outer membrane protein